MSEEKQNNVQGLLYDAKWRRFLKKTWLFRYIPFIEFVFGSGSMAVGNVDGESDFDVLIGARSGRIFTARFCAVIAFGLFGWRRSKLDHSVSASDKICLNHFVTPQAYALSLQKNEYWQRMYAGLAPVYGSDEKFKEFFAANRDWLQKEPAYQADLRHLYKTPTQFKTLIESALSGGFGEWLEKKLKAYQIKRIERGLPKKENAPMRAISITGERTSSFTLAPLIVYTDTELEFHPDPVRIEIVQ